MTTGPEFGEVDIDLLADYIGGVLTGTPDESVVAALIAGDPAWSAAYESLGGRMELVGAELGRLGPEPMPTELADRLTAMFTPPPLTVVSDGAAPSVRKQERDRKSPARAGRRMRWAAPIAVAAGVMAFVGFGLDYLAGRDSSTYDSDSSSAAGLAGSGAPENEQIFHSGRDYTLGTLGSAPVSALAAPDPSAPAFQKSAPNRVADSDATALQRLTLADALRDCLKAIERENDAGVLRVDSVDYARFAGTPAVIVHFTADNGAWGWASGASCGTPGSGAATLGKVPVR